MVQNNVQVKNKVMKLSLVDCLREHSCLHEHS